MYYTLNKEALKSNEFVSLANGHTGTRSAAVFARFLRANGNENVPSRLETRFPCLDNEESTKKLDATIAAEECNVEKNVIVDERLEIQIQDIDNCLDESMNLSKKTILEIKTQCENNLPLTTNALTVNANIVKNALKFKNDKIIANVDNFSFFLIDWFIKSEKSLCLQKLHNEKVSKHLALKEKKTKNENKKKGSEKNKDLVAEHKNNNEIILNEPKRYNGEEDVTEYDNEFNFYYRKTPKHVKMRLMKEASEGIELDPNDPKQKIILNYMKECKERMVNENENQNFAVNAQNMEVEDSENRTVGCFSWLISFFK